MTEGTGRRDVDEADAADAHQDPSWYTPEHKAWLARYEARRQRREQWTSGVILALFTVAAVVEAVLVWVKGTGR